MYVLCPPSRMPLCWTIPLGGRLRIPGTFSNSLGLRNCMGSAKRRGMGLSPFEWVAAYNLFLCSLTAYVVFRIVFIRLSPVLFLLSAFFDFAWIRVH